MRKKKVWQKHDGEMSLLQVTAGTNAIIYNLQAQNRYEVSLLDGMDEFRNPIMVSHTGFVCGSKTRTLQANSKHSLGVVRPCTEPRARGIVRAFSEMDLRQVVSILKVIEHKKSYTKSDLTEIETESIFRLYGDETFFSIFAE